MKLNRFIKIERVFTQQDQTMEDVFNSIEWDSDYTAEIKDIKDNTIFTQPFCEFPKFWSNNSRNTVASKYFYGKLYNQYEDPTRCACGSRYLGGCLNLVGNTQYFVPFDWEKTKINLAIERKKWLDNSGREYSLKQLISRVVTKIATEGLSKGYFNEELEFKGNGYVDKGFGTDCTTKKNSDYNIFMAELAYLIIHQMFAWNSPVWFNIGTDRDQAISACYIAEVQDNLNSIFEHAKTEALIFKDGSGIGTNLSTLRATGEQLRNGNGTSSGPISFMKVYDVGALVVKSAGATRRAAIMRILNVNHPDIEEFIVCKSKEEQKAKILMANGYDKSPGGEAYSSVFFQNSNHSVRISDKFLEAVEKDSDWDLIGVKSGNSLKRVKARKIWDMIAEEAWKTGDPGIQFDDIINEWDTCPETDGRITATNPCAEYVFKNGTSCNLSSINLIKYFDNTKFKATEFLQTVRLATISMNIMIEFADYPTPYIAEMTRKYRTLGIGMTNLGALLMSQAIPYDSEEGRALASSLMSLITAQTYLSSAMIAKEMKPFTAYYKNKEKFINVMNKHDYHTSNIPGYFSSNDIRDLASQTWNMAIEYIEKYGARNAQATVIAPCGTIGLMMDNDTTGCEPELGLVKYKTLVGGGTVKYVNRAVESGLRYLGYSKEDIDNTIKYINDFGTIEGCQFVNENDIWRFDCAFKPKNGKRYLSPESHVKMLGALAPFVSGSVSKTVNLPESATVNDFKNIYKLAKELGVKCIAAYRDNSKGSQPLSTEKEEIKIENKHEDIYPNGRNFWSGDIKSPNKPLNKIVLVDNGGTIKLPKPDLSNNRQRLPDERKSLTHKFTINGYEFYMHIGLYDDGKPGEIFITASKKGSFFNGILDSFATMISMGLQYGVPLESFIGKLKGAIFEPQGFTSNPEIKTCTSVVDYIGKYLELKFIKRDEPINFENPYIDLAIGSVEQKESVTVESNEKTGQGCHVCGTLMVRMGKCLWCPNCSESTGGCGA